MCSVCHKGVVCYIIYSISLVLPLWCLLSVHQIYYYHCRKVPKLAEQLTARKAWTRERWAQVETLLSLCFSLPLQNTGKLNYSWNPLIKGPDLPFWSSPLLLERIQAHYDVVLILEVLSIISISWIALHSHRVFTEVRGKKHSQKQGGCEQPNRLSKCLQENWMGGWGQVEASWSLNCDGCHDQVIISLPCFFLACSICLSHEPVCESTPTHSKLYSPLSALWQLLILPPSGHKWNDAPECHVSVCPCAHSKLSQVHKPLVSKVKGIKSLSFYTLSDQHDKMIVDRLEDTNMFCIKTRSCIISQEQSNTIQCCLHKYLMSKFSSPSSTSPTNKNVTYMEEKKGFYEKMKSTVIVKKTI